MAIDGTYDIVTNTPIGTQEIKLFIETEGNIVSGNGTALGKNYRIENGQAAGNTATFAINADTQFGAVKLDFKLTFEGDKVSGEVSTPFGSQKIEGTKATE